MDLQYCGTYTIPNGGTSGHASTLSVLDYWLEDKAAYPPNPALQLGCV